MNVFTYGSLMYESVWSLVVSVSYERTLADLSGYRRRLLRGQVYPALLAGDATDTVQGVIYLDVQPGDIERLELFEGELYRREKVGCVTRHGERLAAEAFVIRPEYLHLVIDRDWDPDLFARTGLAAFLNEEDPPIP
jgi:gamma-glutamylcyclotransferase (GGCT)/AIG2-like uncharacterized protein YtfP